MGSIQQSEDRVNVPAPNTPYFTPVQSPIVGTAANVDEKTPTIFTPIKIRDVDFQNRIWVAPMCMYSADKGHLTDFHFSHLSAFAYRGASLTIIEATAVLDNGGITPQDSGLWEDSQIEPIRRLATYVHSQGQKLGIQLAHAGRKASTVAPWLVPRGGSRIATKAEGGWEERVWGPSAITWGEGHVHPKEMTLEDIKTFIDGFAASAQRAVKAGVDVIEIHAAHGYLLSSFLSPISNVRTDRYGGSFENRIRILTDVISAVRAVIPNGMPLLVRVSATEWMEHASAESWDIPSTIRLAKLLPSLGVDLLDVSSGGNNEKQVFSPFNDRQIAFASRIRNELHAAGIDNLLIGAVGMITEAEQAASILESTPKSIATSAKGLLESVKNLVVGETTKTSPNTGAQQPAATPAMKETVEINDELGAVAQADVVLVARQFLREPEWVLRVAHKLNVDVAWPTQYGYASKFRAGSKI